MPVQIIKLNWDTGKFPQDNVSFTCHFRLNKKLQKRKHIPNCYHSLVTLNLEHVVLRPRPVSNLGVIKKINEMDGIIQFIRLCMSVVL